MPEKTVSMSVPDVRCGDVAMWRCRLTSLLPHETAGLPILLVFEFAGTLVRPRAKGDPRMKRTLLAAPVALLPTLAIGLALVSGCVVRAQPAPVAVNAEVDYGTAYPSVPPPAPMVEYRPPPPGYGYYWVAGAWDWTGYDWSWTAGFWTPERVGFVYVRPRYVYDGGRYVLYRGYWNDGYGHRDYHYNTTMRGSPPPGGWRSAPPPAQPCWRGGPAPAAGAPPPGGWRGAPPPGAGAAGRMGGGHVPSTAAPGPGRPAPAPVQSPSSNAPKRGKPVH